MKKISIIIIISFLLITFINAKNLSTATYLLINSYPEYSAKGESVGASFTGITSASINPAAIASVENGEIAALYNRYLNDINGQKLSIAKNFSFGILGLEIDYIDFGFIDEVKSDIYGNPTLTDNTFKNFVLFSSLIFSKKINNFHLGIASKFIFENLVQKNNFLFYVDTGIIYKNIFTQNLNFGISLLNISSSMDDFFPPINLKMALNYSIYNNFLTISSAVNYLIKDNYVSLYGGMDLNIFNFFIIRGGINNKFDNINFTTGIGFIIEGIHFDYSYETMPFSENIHKISLSAGFGKIIKDEQLETKIEGEYSFKSYMESGNYYYEAKQYRNAIKYFEYINLLYWRDIENMSDKEKSAFYQKLGICYYNIKDPKRALQYFERAYYFDRDNEILKHWIRLLK
ncbi:MAG: hypothetical protein N3E50_09915 [Candidatus Goldbacteria bacterium]|nr:hypothetical protein [Candidatus Goldiibacteriota bacterium]